MPETPPTAARARVLVGLGGWLMGAGRYGESRAVCEAAAETAMAAKAPAEEGRARSNLGSDLASLGEIAAGIEQLEMARRIGEEHGLVDTLLPASANLAYQLIVADRFDDAVVAGEYGLDAASRYGLARRFGAHFRAVAIDAHLRAGRLDEAEAMARASLETQRSSLGTIYRDAAAARVFAQRGDAAAARDRLTVAEGFAVGEIDADVGAYVALGRRGGRGRGRRRRRRGGGRRTRPGPSRPERRRRARRAARGRRAAGRGRPRRDRARPSPSGRDHGRREPPARGCGSAPRRSGWPPRRPADRAWPRG